MARPFRYTFILVLAAAGTTLAAVGGWRYARASAPVSGPIVMVSVDSLRADRLPAYGYAGVKTPALDALSADGIVFERAYSHAPLTLPAHAALLSGRLPFETGVRGAVGFSIGRGERMLAEMLADRGYATGAVVSSFALRKETGIDQGFAFFDGELPPFSPDVGTGTLERDGLASERLAEEWLQAIRTPRAFLFLHLAEPHRPHAPPERYASYQAYDGEIAYVDEIVGRLVRYLKSHQLYDQSTIIFVSDHGEGLGDHGEQGHGLLVYDEALRVPLIIKRSAGEGAGRRIADLVQLADLTPTILDLAKAPIPGNLHGQSLKTLLDGGRRDELRLVYAESLFGRYHFGWSPIAALTDGRYKLIRSDRETLFDLRDDPQERRDIADEAPDVTAMLSAALSRLSADYPIPTPGHVSQEDRERFEAIGYVARAHPSPASAEGAADASMVEAYRAAVEHDVAHDWAQSKAVIQALLHDDPASVDLWKRMAAVAVRAGSYDLALDAYDRVSAIQPVEADAHLGAATTLWRLRRPDEAVRRAERALSAAADSDLRLRGSAHELLARIAVGRRDAEAARAHARLAQEAEPDRPVLAFIEARLLQDQRRFEAALPLFDQAVAALGRSKGRAIADLHLFAAESLVRLERTAEAEYHFLEELRLFPLNGRARTELATLYNSTGRTDEAAQALADFVRLTPTPEAYSTAARLSQAFGHPDQAAEFRAEARRRSTAARQTAAR